MLYGVDVHAGYQAGLNFPLLIKQGYSFCTVKLTEGVGFLQSGAKDFIAKSKAAGLITGAYHWLDSSGDGATQARWFHKHVVDNGGPAGMLIQLDVEDDGYGPHMTAWTAEWNRLTNSHPFLIYSGSWWWPRTGGFDGSKLTPYLWHSHYLTADTDTVPDDPAAFAARIPADWWRVSYGGWSTPAILQFTSRGDAGALANRVDLNVTRMTREQLLALTGDEDDMLTKDEWATVAKYDALRNGYSDAATNPTIALNTFVFNVARDTAAALKAVARLELKVDALPERPPVDPAALKAALLDPAVLAAIATAVNDDAHRRSAA
jgi:GH25 family lysozyme M1 (1,4-beta-N-acetylmuramidase)